MMDPQTDGKYLVQSRLLASQFLCVMNSKDYGVITEKEVVSDLLGFAIKEYTNSRFYYDINKILARQEFLQVSNYICSILRGLPANQERAYKDSTKPLFRGIRRKFVDMSQYQVGQRLFWPAFTSSSQNPTIAKEFSGKDGVIFVITVNENKPYHNITIPFDWSYFPREQEVLLMPNFHFRVTKITQEAGEKYDYVHIEEIPRTNLLNFQRLD